MSSPIIITASSRLLIPSPAKIVFFDVDDTLFRRGATELRPSTMAAFKALRARNILVAIATGRGPPILPSLIKQLIKIGMIDVLVCVNGQVCLLKGKIIFSRVIPMSHLKSFVKWCNDNKVSYGTSTMKGLAVSEKSANVKTSLFNLVPYYVNPKEYLSTDVYQLNVFLDKDGEKKMVESNILDFKKNYKSIRWHKLAVDILQQEGSKFSGIENVCLKLGIKNEEIIAFGDGLNDIEMISNVGVGVAMGDGHVQLRENAKYITGTIEEDGIYNALVAFGVIDKVPYKL